MENQKEPENLDLTPLPTSLNWFDKISIEFIDDEETGGGTIRLEWDDSDPELQAWTDLGPEKQEAFIIRCLTNAVNNALGTDGI